MRDRKIGVFDSGLGGLAIFRSLAEKLPAYDYVYLGDTKRLPYGDRSQKVIYQFLREAVDFLFARNCELIIVACNTASATALRKIQHHYLPSHYPTRRVLGVIIPAAESGRGAKRVGVIATRATVHSKTFVRELKKIDPRIKTFQQAAPLLVPLIEQGRIQECVPHLRKYLAPLLSRKIDTLILGCTHYVAVKKEVRKIIGPKIAIISQDDILPGKLKTYLTKHKEIEKKLSKKRLREMLVTSPGAYYKKGGWRVVKL